MVAPSSSHRLTSERGSVTALDNIQVADAALTIQQVAIQAVEGVAFSGPVASFADADAGATAGQFTAVFQWGDGLQETLTDIRPNAEGGFEEEEPQPA